MNKTGAWLVRYALEQVGVRYTFGIPGVHNTEIYDELNSSASITPYLVTHEGCGAFMADGVSRTSANIGCIVIVPAAGITHAASGIGEAFLDGIPMLVISGGIRTDSDFSWQLHDIDQHALLQPITKGTFKVLRHEDIPQIIYQAYALATSGEPGPVYVEVPVNIQLYKAPAGTLMRYDDYRHRHPRVRMFPGIEALEHAAELLLAARSPGLFVGWGSIGASDTVVAIAELLGAPIATTLQGLSAVSARHPLHVGMSFGPAAVPAATNAFANCDAMLAVGTRFAEIATGSFGVTVPPNLVHVDINPNAISTNYPAKVGLIGDADEVLKALLTVLRNKVENVEAFDARQLRVATQIETDKRKYADEWLAHDSKDRVNPQVFFQALRGVLPDNAFVVVDDGNHTFLTAELMPIYTPGHLISPTDFNCMGYAVPAAIGVKIANPEKVVVAIVGDGAFMMTGLELITARTHGLGLVIMVFNDGELAQIAQAQMIPYNRKTCTVLMGPRFKGIAEATGSEYIELDSNDSAELQLKHALSIAGQGHPVILDVKIDYSKATRFTQGVVETNLKRLPLSDKLRIVSRAIKRKVTG